MQTQGRAFLNNCVLFAQLLRRAGIPVGSDQVLELVGALEWIDLGERAQVYHTARSLLIRRHEHVRLFDALFNRFWRRLDGADRAARPTMHARRATASVSSHSRS